MLGGTRSSSPRASSRCSARAARRGPDLDQRRSRPSGAAGAHRARGRPRHRRRSAPPSPGEVLGVRGPFGTPGRSRRPRARRRDRGRRDRARRRCGRRCSGCSPARALRPPGVALRRPRRPTSCCSPRSSGVARSAASRSLATVDSAGPEWLGHVGVVTRLIGRADARPARERRSVLRPRGDDALHRRGARGGGHRPGAASTSRWSAT